MSEEMFSILTRIQSDYLNNRGVGIRAFASATNISRSRLKKIFSGEKIPTEVEFVAINNEINNIERRHTAKTKSTHIKSQ